MPGMPVQRRHLAWAAMPSSTFLLIKADCSTTCPPPQSHPHPRHHHRHPHTPTLPPSRHHERRLSKSTADDRKFGVGQNRNPGARVCPTSCVRRPLRPTSHRLFTNRPALAVWSPIKPSQMHILLKVNRRGGCGRARGDKSCVRWGFGEAGGRRSSAPFYPCKTLAAPC